jgi:hypothetical protein
MTRRLAPTLLATFAVALVAALAPGCGRKSQTRSSYTPPPLPAGFVEQTGTGWRIAIPSTWKEAAQKGPAVFAVTDPQSVDDFHAYASVFTEPFPGESQQYAKASEAGLHKEARATVDASRPDVIDGDPTLILESRWAPAPSGGTVSYRTMQAALASHGIGYVATCAVAASAFERYRSTCESIVRSFAVQR